MNHHTIEVRFSPIPAEQEILAATEAQIRRIQGTCLPPEIKADRIEDYFTAAGRELARLGRRAARRRRAVILRAVPGGGQ